MGRPVNNRDSAVHVPLVLELQTRRNFGEFTATIVASVPNREGTLSRSWRSHDGVMDDKQVRDLDAWTTKLILDAFMTLGGVQQSLTVR